MLAKDFNYKLQQARKLIQSEQNRVTRHKKLRAKQLEIEEELRVRQLIKERDDVIKAKNFIKQKTEDLEDLRARTA